MKWLNKMIFKEKYGNIENVTIVQFGFGTTRVVNSSGETHKAILLGAEDEPKQIGEIGAKHITSDSFKPDIAIVFHCEKSFSVFEEYVKNIRKEYEYLKTSHL